MPLNPNHLAALIAFAVALAATPWIAARAAGLGLVDQPGARRVHQTPTPRTGGLGLWVGLCAGLFTLALETRLPLAAGTCFVLPALGYFALGWWDDRHGVAPREKFVLQVLLAALAVGSGLRWGGVGIGPLGYLGFGALTPILSVLWIVAVVTVMNWIDGIDLITALTGLVLLGTGAGFGVGPLGGGLFLCATAALLGVAIWNVSPARVFLGDAGTHLLGFLVAVLPMQVVGLPGSEPLPWALASAPLLPAVIDIALGLWVKYRRGVPLWRAHRQHLHHRLVRSGRSHPAVAARYAALALIAVVTVGHVMPTYGWLAGVCVGGGWVGLHLVDAIHRTRGMPYEFADDAPAKSPQTPGARTGV